MNAVVSTSINFQNAADVAAYMQLNPAALPDDDTAYTGVTRYIVGYAHIILFGENGRRMAKLHRRNVRGFAVDGEPVVVHGPDFKRIGIPGEDQPQDDEAAPDCKRYLVEWDDFEGNHHEASYDSPDDAEAEYEAALKEYQNVTLTDLLAADGESKGFAELDAELMAEAACKHDL